MRASSRATASGPRVCRSTHARYARATEQDYEHTSSRAAQVLHGATLGLFFVVQHAFASRLQEQRGDAWLHRLGCGTQGHSRLRVHVSSLAHIHV